MNFQLEAHVGETGDPRGEGVPRLAFVLRQNDARDMHVGEFIDGAPGGTDGEVHAFHHAGHDVGGVLETEQRIAEGLDVPDQLVAVRVARPGYDPDGDARSRQSGSTVSSV